MNLLKGRQPKSVAIRLPTFATRSIGISVTKCALNLSALGNITSSSRGNGAQIEKVDADRINFGDIGLSVAMP